MITAPLLGVPIKDPTSLTYPLLATPKIDGIRCIIQDGTAWSRKLKLIPNQHVRAALHGCPDGLDGELVCLGGFNETQSRIMSIEGEPVFLYMVFDYVHSSLDEPYSRRVRRLPGLKTQHIWPVEPAQISTPAELLRMEEQMILLGYEGVCVRSPDSPYKCGRSTLKQQYLLKMKRFVDAEATIIGWRPLLTNTNTQERDELGHAKRSKAKAGLEELERLGSLEVRDTLGRVFSIGSGFTMRMRDWLWDTRDSLIGKTIVYKHQPYGEKDAPRFPVFKGFRYD